MESTASRCPKLGKALLMTVAKMTLRQILRLQTCGVRCYLHYAFVSASDIILVAEQIQKKFPWYKRMHTLMGTSPIVDRSAIAHSQTRINLDVLARDSNSVSLFSCRNLLLMIIGCASVPVVHLTGIWISLARTAACLLLVHCLALRDLMTMILSKWRCRNATNLLPPL